MNAKKNKHAVALEKLAKDKTSNRKRDSSRSNGLKGGRPKKEPPKAEGASIRVEYDFEIEDIAALYRIWRSR